MPAKSSWVQRQYLKRLYQLLPERGIQFASSAITVQTLGKLESEAPNVVAAIATAAAAAQSPPPTATPAANG